MVLKYLKGYLFLSCVYVSHSWSDTRVRRFPDGFLFGVATSAYQVEGAWNVDGKAESIWDRFVHTRPGDIADATTGDDAADSYHQLLRDVMMLRELGVDVYRFSVAWTRVLPRGFPNHINEPGLKYYDSLIQELTKYNIEPMITMYHFDLPQSLQDLGGWANPLSIDWFEDYARVLFERYGSLVKYWVTFNQPDFCMEGYGQGIMAPGVRSRGVGDYLCVKHVLLAHARVWRMYDREYRKKFGGSVGISVSINWFDPYDNSTENVQATEEYREFAIGIYLNPIFGEDGNFPAVIRSLVSKYSKEEGFPRNRLPTLSSEEQASLKGSSDFLAMNHYTTFLMRRTTTSGSEIDDTRVNVTGRKEWKRAKSWWLRSVPYGLYKAILYINAKYNYPPIFITENGWSSDPGLHDDDRAENIREYLRALQLAMEDGGDVRGYTYWSLMDNFEWAAGHSERFGLYEVDFNSTQKTRRARKSALVYKQIISSRVVDDWEPDSLDITVSNRRTDMRKKIEL